MFNSYATLIRKKGNAVELVFRIPDFGIKTALSAVVAGSGKYQRGHGYQPIG
jgi:hypothetical protein